MKYHDELADLKSYFDAHKMDSNIDDGQLNYN